MPDNLTPGDHYVQIVVVAEDLKRAYVLAQRIPFAVHAASQ